MLYRNVQNVVKGIDTFLLFLHSNERVVKSDPAFLAQINRFLSVLMIILSPPSTNIHGGYDTTEMVVF
jgi:hypothetical protein